MGNRLERKIALVTGGSAGIGAECCKLFAREGAIVFAGDLKPLSYEAENVEYIRLDVTDTKNCEEVVSSIKNRHGKIDVLVNNAGITRDALIHKMTDELWDIVIDINLKGVFNMARLIGPLMMENGYGSIINISSVVGEFGNIGQTNYAATKMGVVGMAKTWAKEFARKGANVRCNAIAPGYVMTDILKTVPQDLLDQFAGLTMLGRLGEPEEIAKAALFLASDESSYVTGHLLSVNGGMRL
ncbi:MAG: 3-oxoacyl-ACP reductase FabG [Clostridiales Family XIII bacterium]|jgi:3-oxoacyl-[acyl-carrier protein] reductase|nr:3-oxoacyl-ACP reductase FabG [Clostridiales Family XIII bacterium]